MSNADPLAAQSEALPGPPAGLDESVEMEFQVAPMVDVLLVLLLFFMATTTTEVITQTADLELPKATDSQAKEEGAGKLIINVERLNFKIKVNDQYFENPDDIIPMIKSAAQNAVAGSAPGKGFRVIVRADKETSFERVSGIMKSCAQAGVLDVVFSVYDDKEKK